MNKKKINFITIFVGDLHSKKTSVDLNGVHNELRIVGLKVQVDDDQIYSFSLEKTRCKSADILSVLSAADDLKIPSTCIENKEVEIHIKPKNEPFSSSVINEQQYPNEDYSDGDQPVEVVKISLGKDESHYVKYAKESLANSSKFNTEIVSGEVQTEKATTLANLYTMNFDEISPHCVENNQSEIERPSKSSEKVIGSEKFESKQDFITQKAFQTGKETTSTYLQAESGIIFAKEKQQDVSMCAKQTNNVTILSDVNLVDRKNVSEISANSQYLPFAPLFVDKAEKIKATEHQIEEYCQCSCGHKKQHDCIYKCCYHLDPENIIPTNILLGQNLHYLANMYTVLKCDYCRCRLNRSCSETTNNCIEKFKSDIHPKYCCKCESTDKSAKDIGSTSIKEIEKLENLKTIQLKQEIFSSSAWKERFLDQPKLEIFKNLENVKEKEQNNTNMRLCRSPKMKKVRFLKKPIVIEPCLNSCDSTEGCQSKTEKNRVDIESRKKIFYENTAEEQLKYDADSPTSESDKERKGASTSAIFSEMEKKSVEKSNKLNTYYSHSELCPINKSHKNERTFQAQENAILLIKPSGTFVVEKEESSSEQFRSISPKIKSENFDYITKDDWKLYDQKSEEYLSKKTEAIDDIHLEDKEISDEECSKSITQDLDDACEIVNKHLLSSQPFNENKVKKAAEILHKRWFAVVGTKHSDVFEVRNFIQYLKGFSNNLLKTLLHSVDNNGNNILHFAFANNKFDLVDELLKCGFALDLFHKKNKSANTALMVCAISQPKNFFDWTVARRCFQLCDVNEKSAKNGQTLLMNAASCGFEIMVDLLLDIGANPNLQDKDGSTALMYAAEHGHVKCIKSLMRHDKCDPTIKDEEGETACSIALKKGYKNIAVLIHMQALKKRRFSQNQYSIKRFVWPSSNETAKKKSVPSTAVFDSVRPWENH